MSHGAPDWGVFAAKKTVYSLQDMAELAARLGSIVTFDRKGDVIWMDDFEANINKWQRVTSGTGASVTLSAEAARNGALSAKLTTGSEIDAYAQITRWQPTPVLSKLGFEVSFTLHAGLDYLRLSMNYYDGSLQHWSSLKYDRSEDKLYCLSPAGTWQVISPQLFLVASSYQFHTWKLVADPANDLYVRALLDNVKYDLSSYSMPTTISSENPKLEVAVVGYNAAADSTTFYLGDAIITQNEP